jgi:uncharacterized protein YjdB
MSRTSNLTFMKKTAMFIALAASLLAAACEDATPPRAVASVGLSPAAQTLIVGQEVALTASPRDAGGAPIDGRAVSWSSSNQSVARVSAAGLVTAVNAGTASIQATIDGKSGTTQITVVPIPVARVQVTPPALSLAEGESRALTAIALDASGRVLEGRNIVWLSRDPAIVEVDATGRLIAKRSGSVVVSATVEDQTADVTVTITRRPVATISVSPTGVVLQVGTTRQLTATLHDASGNSLTDRAVVWTTDSPMVVEVNGTGRLSATGPGYATIVATSEGKTFGVGVTVVEGDRDAMPHDLVYHRTTPQALGEIIILPTAGTSGFTRVNAGNVSRQPTASPNGNRLAFYVSQRELNGDQTDDIFAVDRNGLNMKRLTSAPGYDGEPAWSPAGDAIAYRHADFAPNGRSDIWVMRADGSLKVNLTGDVPAGVSVGSPAWSPDGSRIAFQLLRTGFSGPTFEIWAMNADGSNKELITWSNAGDRTPTWSPDGMRIAFIRAYGDDTDITIVNVGGGAATRLELPGRQEGPEWSPDGRHIAFWQPVGATGATAVYTVRADGTNVRLHTLPSWGGGYDPTWIRR